MARVDRSGQTSASAPQAQTRTPTHKVQLGPCGLALARVTALQKPGGGARGIATGDVFRRLVSGALAQGWADTFEATRPYQFALKARAGTDALAAHVRASLDMRPDAVVVSLDGRNAYDSMSRAAFLSAELLRAEAGSFLCACGMATHPRTYGGREVWQGEGCEQGDPWPLPCTRSASMVP